MKNLLVTLSVLILAVDATAQPPSYTFGGGASIVTFKGGDFFKFDWETAYSFHLGHRLSDRWNLNLDYSSFTLPNDNSVDSTDVAGMIPNNANLEFRCDRIGLMAERKLIAKPSWWNITTGIGGGALIWKGVDVASNTPYIVGALNGGQTDFSATELFLTGQAGFLIKPFDRIFLNFDFRADYLTGAGVDFASYISDNLDKFVLSAGVRLSFGFGSSSGDSPTRWRSDSLWQAQPATPVTRKAIVRDGDGDGVDDDKDDCLGTPTGAIVGPNGCALDSDNDGVPDGLDDCPGTPPGAAGKVDLFGCPVDSDFDGVPDFADNCPTNAIGAIVNDQGCPVDSDGDGVPDGLDDCPGTLTGLDVDLHGCVDLSGFAQPMVLNIDYPPGGFEIDPNSRERLKKLATTLNFVKELKLDIYGYTDNIGTTKANQQMSEKRARRVRDFLIANGVEADRIRYEGKGETNFVASNDTADGRARNRRIEIIFYR